MFTHWRKSSKSLHNPEQCVEVATARGKYGIRDSKTQIPAYSFSTATNGPNFSTQPSTVDTTRSNGKQGVRAPSTALSWARSRLGINGAVSVLPAHSVLDLPKISRFQYRARRPRALALPD